MKRLFTILAAVLLTASVLAQSPEKMSYQAVIRNSSDALVINTQVGMQIGILQATEDGSPVYVETQTPTTNANGLVSIEIGTGTVVSGDFSTIDWANGPYFIKTETDPAGSTNYKITGISQLLSVPYALYAKTAGASSGLPVHTTTEIAALSPAQGDAVFNSTEGLYQVYDGSAWQSFNANCWPQPTTANAGTDQTITDGTITATLAANTPEAEHGTGAWTIISGTGGSFADASSPTSTFTGQLYESFELQWSITTSCDVSSDNVKVFFGVITNPTTGKIWMARNLGASQVATSSTDADAYGDLYQWGRGTDGHEKRTSGTTSTLSNSDTPGHGDFILAPDSPYDWRSSQNDNLWQGVSGTNNPCPSGYRLPTEAEWEAERTSWGSSNAAGAFGSPLKLPMAGLRDRGGGSLDNVGSFGWYWSSTVGGTFSRSLYFRSSSASMGSYIRMFGFSVRCLKD